MADLDRVADLEALSTYFASACNRLVDLSLRLAQEQPGESRGWARWAQLVEQKRELAQLALEREIDIELRR